MFRFMKILLMFILIISMLSYVYSESNQTRYRKLNNTEKNTKGSKDESILIDKRGNLNKEIQSLAQKVKDINVNKRIIVEVKKGSGPDDIGMISGYESSPIYPKSFSVGKNGEIYILDQVNKRVQVFKNGKRDKTIPIPFDSFEDIAIISCGKIGLIDIEVKESVYIIDFKGKLLNKISIIDIPHDIYSSFIGLQIVEFGEYKGLWINSGGDTYKIVNLDGSKAEKIALPGKILYDGNRIFDEIIDYKVFLYTFKVGTDSKYYQIRFVMDIGNFNLPEIIGKDEKGFIYLLWIEEKKGNKRIDFDNYILIIDPETDLIIGKFEIIFDPNIKNSLKVTRDGCVYSFFFDEKKDKFYVLKYEPFVKK